RSLRAIRRAGVSPPGAERGGVGGVLCAVRTAGAHGAQRLGLAHHTRGHGYLQSQGWARPADRRVGRRRAAMALRPVLHDEAGDRAALYALELPAAGGETFWVDLR